VVNHRRRRPKNAPKRMHDRFKWRGNAQGQEGRLQLKDQEVVEVELGPDLAYWNGFEECMTEDGEPFSPPVPRHDKKPWRILCQTIGRRWGHRGWHPSGRYRTERAAQQALVAHNKKDSGWRRYKLEEHREAG
jgi:hypothetical protein